MTQDTTDQDIDALKAQIRDVDLCYARNLLSACIDNLDMLIEFEEDDHPKDAPMYARSEVRRLFDLAETELLNL